MKPLKPEQLIEENFQGFLEKNREYIFVFETPDYEYPQYFAVAKLLTKSVSAAGRFARQWG